jgi:hypothetical protein
MKEIAVVFKIFVSELVTNLYRHFQTFTSESEDGKRGRSGPTSTVLNRRYPLAFTRFIEDRPLGAKVSKGF